MIKNKDKVTCPGGRATVIKLNGDKSIVSLDVRNDEYVPKFSVYPISAMTKIGGSK